MNAKCYVNHCQHYIEYHITDQHGLFIKCSCASHIRDILSRYDQPHKAKVYMINQNNGRLIKRPNLFRNNNHIAPLIFPKISFIKEQCSICLEPLTSIDSFELAFCNHRFHKHCISKWSTSDFSISANNQLPCRSKKRCPICRGGIILVKDIFQL